jgi:hypothetical protein
MSGIGGHGEGHLDQFTIALGFTLCELMVDVRKQIFVN